MSDNNQNQAPAIETTTTAPVEASNVPESFLVKRNEIELEFVRQSPRRKGKGGVELNPTFAPVVTKDNLEQYVTFAGEETFLAELNGSIFTKYFKQQQGEDSLWSPNGQKFDQETAIARAIGAEQAKENLESEAKKLSEEFTAARNSGNMEAVLAIADKLQGLLMRQAEQKHKGKK